MPGVFSARWAGRHGDDEANLELLLGQLASVPPEHLGAAFVCAAALVLPDGREFVRHGQVRGRLVRSPRGTGGFGYDPIFVSDGESCTNAELSPDRKDAISHRGKAFRALAALLSDLSALCQRASRASVDDLATSFGHDHVPKSSTLAVAVTVSRRGP